MGRGRTVVELAGSAAVCALATGCLPGPAPSFYAANPADRVRAADDAGDARDEGAVPELINQLESDDAAQRAAAIASLREITGRDHGYEWWAGGAERRAAAERWAAWYAQTQGTTARQDAADDRSTDAGG